MHCRVPGCKKFKVGSFATVPVCYEHQEELMDEAIMYYSKRIDERPTFESIRQMTPWKGVEPGDTHKAIVRKMKNGIVTAYEIKGGRYVLEHANAYKGAKRL
ncbi:hypothetical protein [Paenibacillus rhizolycopersici]|uniref:hypothetical protein n=1 Tax=Paenibacillus rhizolycopersici TaxID=2780073 RepID=UPI003D2AEC2D